MSKNMCASSKLLTLLIAILLYTQANAGILRLYPTSTSTVKPTTTTVEITTDTLTTTTTTTEALKGITSKETILENTEATFLPKDIDNIDEKLLTTTTVSNEEEGVENAEEDEDTTENHHHDMALSRDEEATIKLTANKNPNQNFKLDAEVLKIETTHKSNDGELKLSKLLLASVPKTSQQKQKEFIEENIEEPKETTEDQIQTTTNPSFETTTIINNDSKSSSESEESKEEKDTKVVPLLLPEMVEKPHVDNAAHEVLEVEDIDDYLVVDEDENLEYEPHSETYVHSIQIVPSRLEAVLLENFVHDW